jgi:hypothetical protein
MVNDTHQTFSKMRKHFYYAAFNKNLIRGHADGYGYP